jgi:hypothetical protein
MIDLLLEAVDARPAIARGVLDRHGRSEAYHVGIPRGVRDIYSATVAGVPIRIVMALVTYGSNAMNDRIRRAKWSFVQFYGAQVRFTIDV